VRDDDRGDGRLGRTSSSCRSAASAPGSRRPLSARRARTGRRSNSSDRTQLVAGDGKRHQGVGSTEPVKERKLPAFRRWSGTFGFESSEAGYPPFRAELGSEGRSSCPVEPIAGRPPSEDEGRAVLIGLEPGQELGPSGLGACVAARRDGRGGRRRDDSVTASAGTLLHFDPMSAMPCRRGTAARASSPTRPLAGEGHFREA